MPFTIKHADDDVGLCGRCREAVIMRGERQRDVQVYCQFAHPPVALKFVVHRCSEFSEIGKPKDYEMEKIAWVIEVKAGKFIGFRPPTKRQGEE